MEEKQAIEFLKRGDMNGLEYLVNTFYLQAVRSSYLIVREKTAAEDIVQTFFLELPQKIAGFDDVLLFRPWLMKSIVNASLNSLKKTTRFLSLEANSFSDESFLDELIDTNPMPEDQLITEEVRQVVWKSLGKLTPNQRAVIVMRYYLQLNEVEMANNMKRPRSSIKWWLYSAKNRLRKLLQPYKSTLVNKEDPYSESTGDSKETDYE